MAEMRFLLALELFHAREERRYFVAEHEGRAVEFLSAVPIPMRNGWLVEDIIRSRTAPNGTTESLFHALLGDVGFDEFVTLGLSPLIGRVPLWMRVVRHLTQPLYSFSGLHAFKARLMPIAWEAVWLVLPRRERAVPHIIESLRAFAGGSLVAFAARSLIGYPSAPPFALAVPLIPWTLLLVALVALHRAPLLGFTRWELSAWVLFDAALAIALILTSMRPRRRALALLTIAAGVDALSSAIHLALVGLGPTLLEASLRVLSAAAPLFGTIALAWATAHAPRTRHRRRHG
jgi:hypothetical protein